MTVLPATTSAEPVFTQHAGGNPPERFGGVIRLLSGEIGESNSVALDPISAGPVRQLTVEGKVRLEPGSQGLGILLLDTARRADVPTLDAWEEPNLDGSIGIGLDSSNPPSDNPMDDGGNIYDRPQREVSLHLNGTEVRNKLAPEFAIDKPVAFKIDIEFVEGGGYISVMLDGKSAYDREFIPELRPAIYRPILGARGANKAALSDLKTSSNGPMGKVFDPPVRIDVLSLSPILAAGPHEATAQVDFSQIPPTARVIATLSLFAPPGGLDPFDRRGAVYIYTSDKQRFELLRFITPFAKPHTWQADVTDLLPLMKDSRQIGVFIDTWQNGFAGSLSLDFYPGTPQKKPIAVVNLWQGEAILGDPSSPVERFFDEKLVLIPPAARSASLRITTTGHGQAPNTLNAAEFLPLGRTVRVNGNDFSNELWKDDCYLNPCRPQRGTWKFDRAGWAPGSIVEPWRIDISNLLVGKRDISVTYTPAPYVNQSAGRAEPPFHWVDSQVIFYDR